MCVRRSRTRTWSRMWSFEKLFSAIAQRVRGCGHIEIGDQEMFGFGVLALDDRLAVPLDHQVPEGPVHPVKGKRLHGLGDPLDGRGR